MGALLVIFFRHETNKCGRQRLQGSLQLQGSLHVQPMQLSIKRVAAMD